MNPFTGHTQPTPAPDTRNCAECRDMGFIMPPEFDPDPKSRGVPAGVLYRYARPCHCAAGRLFAEEQRRWNGV